MADLSIVDSQPLPVGGLSISKSEPLPGQHVQAHPLKGQNFGDWLSEELLQPVVDAATQLGRGIQGLGHPEQRPLAESVKDVVRGGSQIVAPFAAAGLNSEQAPAGPPTAGAHSAVGTALKGAATGAVKAIPKAAETSILRYTGVPQIARGAYEGAKSALKARAEAATPPAEAPAAPAAAPAAPTEDEQLLAAIQRGQQNAAAQSASAAPKAAPRPPEYYGVKPEQTPPTNPAPSAPAPAQPASAAPSVTNIQPNGGPLRPPMATASAPEPPSAPTAPIRPEVPAKEPWQMTQEEYLDSYEARTRPEIAKEVNRKVGELQAGIERMRADIASDPGNPANGSKEAWIADTQKTIQEQTNRLTAPLTNPREMWSPAQIQWHHVGHALEQGKPVPPEALAAYPELAPKASAPPTAKVQPIRPAPPAPEPPQPKQASGAQTANAQAKADRFVKAIQDYNAKFNAQPITADAIAGLDDTGKAVLARSLSGNGLLPKVDANKFPNTSWPYIVTKLRQAEYTAQPAARAAAPTAAETTAPIATTPAAPAEAPAATSTAAPAPKAGVQYKGFLATLGDAERENLFSVMREYGNKAMKYAEQHAQLRPKYGEIAVGGAHMDPLINQYGIEAVSRELGRGAAIDDAIAAGKQEATLTAQKFNERVKGAGGYQIHRPEGMANSMLDEYGRRLKAALKQ